ncbi:MAG: phosphatidate cytidylyltransferase [Alphaproteobacteria bacterium]
MAQVQAKPDFKRELHLRIVSSAIIVPVVAFADYAGGLPFDLMLLILCATMAWEWGTLSAVRRKPSRYLLIVLACAPVAVFLASTDLRYALPTLAICSVLAAVGVAGLEGNRGKRLIGGGIAYIGLASLSAIWIRGQADGFGLFTLLLIIVIATDVFAFLTGRMIGGPKVAPSISPNKTWSGALGGLAASLVAAFVFHSFYHGTPHSLLEGPANGMTGAVVFGAAVLSVASQAGDFFESWLKRRVNVKDSGSIIPGHGGMLDRLDGFLAATPVLAIMLAVYGMISSA